MKTQQQTREKTDSETKAMSAGDAKNIDAMKDWKSSVRDDKTSADGDKGIEMQCTRKRIPFQVKKNALDLRTEGERSHGHQW